MKSRQTPAVSKTTCQAMDLRTKVCKLRPLLATLSLKPYGPQLKKARIRPKDISKQGFCSQNPYTPGILASARIFTQRQYYPCTEIYVNPICGLLTVAPVDPLGD